MIYYCYYHPLNTPIRIEFPKARTAKEWRLYYTSTVVGSWYPSTNSTSICTRRSSNNKKEVTRILSVWPTLSALRATLFRKFLQRRFLLPTVSQPALDRLLYDHPASSSDWHDMPSQHRIIWLLYNILFNLLLLFTVSVSAKYIYHIHNHMANETQETRNVWEPRSRIN